MIVQKLLLLILEEPPNVETRKYLCTLGTSFYQFIAIYVKIVVEVHHPKETMYKIILVLVSECEMDLVNKLVHVRQVYYVLVGSL